MDHGPSTQESAESPAAPLLPEGRLPPPAWEFLSQIVILVLGVTAGKLVRSREVLAAETATRLRLAGEERAAEAGRVVAEERLRIARELHDTVAHSMATITVQAGSALHLLDSDAPTRGLRTALTAIRETSKGALTEMRSVLGSPRGPRWSSGCWGCWCCARRC